MIITKSQALEIATKMVEVKHTALRELEQQISKMVYKAYMDALPKEVVEFANKHADFVKHISQVRVRGFSIGSVVVTVDDVPTKNDLELPNLTLNDSDLNILNSIFIQKDNLKKEIDERVRELENTLLSLETMERISKYFPQVIEFVLAEKYESTVSSETISDLQSWLNN